MSFYEYPIATRGSCRARKDRRQNAIPSAAVANAARSLHRVGRIKDYRIPKFPNPIERTHICNKIVVTEADTSLRKDVRMASESFEFARDISDIPGCQELS